MNTFSNVTEQDLFNLRKQNALKIKNRILKQTHDIKLAESLSPITKKLDANIESTQKIGEIVQKSDVDDGDTQTPAMENITSTQSKRDT